MPNNDDVVCCDCGEPAQSNVVRKEGPNKGRRFMGCASRTCKFFQWVSETAQPVGQSSSNNDQQQTNKPSFKIPSKPASSSQYNFAMPSSQSSTQQNTNAGQSSITIPKCKHGTDAMLLRVKKEGPNQGKYFWSCADKSESCKYFLWFSGKETDYHHLLNVNHNKKAEENVKEKTTTTKKTKVEFEICTVDVNNDNEVFVREFERDEESSENDREQLSEFDNAKSIQSIALRVTIPGSVKDKIDDLLSKFNRLDHDKPDQDVSKKIDRYYSYSDYSAMVEHLKKEKTLHVEEIPGFVAKLIEQYQSMSKMNNTINVWEHIPEKLQEALLPFQRIGVEFGIKREGRVMIADEMGLGKTIQCIAIATYFSSDWPLWIVCPGSLKANWKKEILKWIGGQTLTVNGRKELITANEINIIETGNQIHDGTSIINIISYDLLAKDTILDIVKTEFSNRKRGVIVCDESHQLKSLSSKRSQSLVPLIEESKRAVLASGTSIMSRPIEVYSQLKAILSKDTIKKLEFGYRYCGITQKPQNDSDYRGSSHLSELYCLLANTIMIRRLKRDVLSELPPKRRSKYYLEIKEEDLKKINSIGADTKKKGGYQNDWKKLQRDRDVVAKYIKTGEAKIEGIKKYLRKIIAKQEKFLIFAHHKCVMDAIEETVKVELGKLSKLYSSNISDDILDTDIIGSSSKTKTSSFFDVDDDLEEDVNFDYIRIDGDTKDREGYAHHFRSSEKCMVAILSMNVAGCGLNFVPCNIVIFAELNWSPALLNQCEDRCHRIGQQCSFVDIRYLLAKKTLDDFMWSLLTKKADITDEALNGQKEIKENHLTRSVEDITTPKKKELRLVSRGSIEKFLKKPSPTTSTISDTITSTSTLDSATPEPTTSTPTSDRSSHHENMDMTMIW